MQNPDVVKADIIEDFKILIEFKNGEERIFDLKPYLNYTVFKPLMDETELYSFKIIDGTIEWECGADLSPDTFYLESVPVTRKSSKVV